MHRNIPVQHISLKEDKLIEKIFFYGSQNVKIRKNFNHKDKNKAAL
jgi:hypothetical protein